MNKIGNIVESRKISLLLILIITFLTFSNSIFNGLVIDDSTFLISWQTPHNISNIPKLLIGYSGPDTFSPVYRPLRSVAYAFYYQFWGSNPLFYHIAGILIHLIIVVFIYLIFDNLFKNRKIAFLGGLLFALHPIHTEAIDWISAAMDLIGVFFFFLSFYLFLLFKTTKKRKNRYYLFSLLSAALAFLGNELTLILPLIVFFYLVFVDKFNLIKFKKHLQTVLGYFFIAIIYLFIRFFVLNISSGQIVFFQNITIALFMTEIFVKYLFLLVIPIHLSVNHLFNSGIESYNVAFNNPDYFYSHYLFNFSALISLSLVIGVTIISFIFYKRIPLLIFGLVWVYLSILPVIILPTATFSERYAYIASFGFILIVVSLHKLIPQKWSKWALIMLCFLSLLYGFVTYQRNKDWQNEATLWTSVVKIYPKSALAYYNMGAYYSETRQYNKAIDAYRKAIELRKDSVFAYYNLADAYEKTGRQNDAIRIYKKILTIDSSFKLAAERLIFLQRKTWLKYNQNFLTFSYPSFFNLTETEKGVILKDKLSDFTITMESTSIQEGITVQDYLNKQKISYGRLANQGLAKIPLVDYAYAKIWILNKSSQMDQFFLFSKGKVIEIRIFPANAFTMKIFDQIVLTIKQNENY